MARILVTGATGNVGKAVLGHLKPDAGNTVFRAGYRMPLGADELYFNFNDLQASLASLSGTDVLFLLRPPHISDVARFFGPLIKACAEQGVKHIVFLSVQGVEKSSIIPHHRIEKLIRESGIHFTFIRPSYFMQNLTTTLLQDLHRESMVFLPAGRAPFLWVDVDDIGRAVAAVLADASRHQNKAYTITGKDLLSFDEVAAMISRVTGKVVRYVSPSLLSFIYKKKKEGMALPYILVLIMLHYLARFDSPPAVSDDFFRLTGLQPKSLEEFLREHAHLLQER